MNSFKQKTFAVKLLCVLQILLGIGAVFGGGALVIDPSGKMIGMPSDMMKLPWFPDYFIPGMILLLVLGVLPLVVTSSLIWKWDWKLGEKLNVFKQTHWSWAFSLYVSFALLIWITVEMYIINAASIVHVVYVALGLAIQIVTLLPSVSEVYEKKA